MTALKNTPLIYTLGMIQFPKVPGIERFIDPFLDKIRNEYPLVDEVKVPVFNADFSPQGIQIGQYESKLWQFMSVDRKWGFILTEQALCLHTVDYRDFSNFSNHFQKGLEAFLKVPGIGIDWVTALGIRYVNLVVAKGNHSLKDYLDSWVLPTEPPRSQLSIIEGAYVARYKTDIGELRLQSMRNPQYTLPPELQSPLIVKNGWIQSRPETDFALIDIDHSITFSQPASMKTKEILKHLKELRGISKEVFISVGTKFSHAAWG
jgi:uncharacterized protein (TIGR04255 family)